MTSTGPKYSAPPIVEAIVQIAFAEPLGDSLYRKVSKRLARFYRNELPSEQVNANVNFVTRDAAFASIPQLRLSNADETDILMVTPHGLTWSRLAPYEGWDTFFARIRAEAAAAYDITGPRKPARLGVRYVNRLDVPFGEGGLVRYEDYLAINISVPDKWPSVETYAWRFERAFDDLLAVVQSAIIEAEVPETGAFVLDIDVIAQHELPLRLDDIFAKLLKMRDVKNDIFETSITDFARESFAL